MYPPFNVLLRFLSFSITYSFLYSFTKPLCLSSVLFHTHLAHSHLCEPERGGNGLAKISPLPQTVVGQAVTRNDEQETILFGLLHDHLRSPSVVGHGLD